MYSPQPLDYRVPGRHHPQPLAVAEAPLQVATRAHEPFEDLGEVPGVEHHEAHTAEHPLVRPLDHPIGDLFVGHMAPPEEHVRGVEDPLVEAVLGLAERGGADLEATVSPERRR
jgi:hypothetical protein